MHGENIFTANAEKKDTLSKATENSVAISKHVTASALTSRNCGNETRLFLFLKQKSPTKASTITKISNVTKVSNVTKT